MKNNKPKPELDFESAFDELQNILQPFCTS